MASLAQDSRIGTYTLTRDWFNPQGDKRKKRDWTVEKMQATGTVFYVLPYYGGPGLAIRRAGAEGHEVIIESDPRFGELAAVLEWQDDKPSDSLRRNEEGKLALAMLDYLHRTGAIDWNQLERARAYAEGQDYIDPK